MLINFQNSFTIRLSNDCLMKSSFKILPHPKRVATLLWWYRGRPKSCPSVLITWYPGWWSTGYKSTLPRRRYCGVPQLIVSIRCQVIQYVLATHLCCQCQLFMTLESTLMLTWVWEPTSLQPSGPVLWRCDRSVVCAVHWRRCSVDSAPRTQAWLLLFNVGWCVWNTAAEISLCWTPPLD